MGGCVVCNWGVRKMRVYRLSRLVGGAEPEAVVTFVDNGCNLTYAGSAGVQCWPRTTPLDCVSVTGALEACGGGTCRARPSPPDPTKYASYWGNLVQPGRSGKGGGGGVCRSKDTELPLPALRPQLATRGQWAQPGSCLTSPSAPKAPEGELCLWQPATTMFMMHACQLDVAEMTGCKAVPRELACKRVLTPNQD